MVSCNWRYGEGPCGKTYEVLDKNDKVFTYVNDNQMLANYNDEDTLLINYDEVEMPLQKLLCLIDFINQKGQFSKKFSEKLQTLNLKNVEILSNRHPLNVFESANKNTYNALVRRINIIWHYKKGEEYKQEMVS